MYLTVRRNSTTKLAQLTHSNKSFGLKSIVKRIGEINWGLFRNQPENPPAGLTRNRYMMRTLFMFSGLLITTN